MHALTLAEVTLAGKRVFIRSDLNVPQDDAGAITDDSRIRASVPAIRQALAGGAALVMVTSSAVASAGTAPGSVTSTDPLSPSASPGFARVSTARTGAMPTNLPAAAAALGENSPEISITM